MTEAEWWSEQCGVPPVLEEVGRSGLASRRKLFLLGCAYCRRLWEWLAPLPWTLLPSESRTARLVEVAERHADGLADADEFRQTLSGAADAVRDWEVTLDELVEDDEQGSLRLRQAFAWHVWDLFDPFVDPDSPRLGPLWDRFADRWCGLSDEVGQAALSRGATADEVNAVLREETAAGVALARDVFGNPFRPVAFDAAWRTSTATALATQMYESRDFGAMPILADALQDAGCTSADILEHCREANATHVRGCWVVDLVLGKE